MSTNPISWPSNDSASLVSAHKSLLTIRHKETNKWGEKLINAMLLTVCSPEQRHRRSAVQIVCPRARNCRCNITNPPTARVVWIRAESLCCAGETQNLWAHLNVFKTPSDALLPILEPQRWVKQSHNGCQNYSEGQLVILSQIWSRYPKHLLAKCENMLLIPIIVIERLTLTALFWSSSEVGSKALNNITWGFCPLFQWFLVFKRPN